MKFEKNLYTLKKKTNWIKPLFSSFLLLFFMFNPMQVDALNEACEGVEFTLDISLVRGVCESGEQAIVNVKVTDGTNQEYGYDWTDNLGNSGYDIFSGNDFNILSLPASTNFCVTVERQETEGGCIQQACIAIPAVSTLNCAIELTNDFGCDGESTGQLTATITGGQGFYFYEWSSEATACSEGSATDVSGESNAVISNLAPGRYSLTVTDATGCSSNRRVCDIEVCLPESLSAELEANQPDCEGNVGSLMSFPSGGAGEYTYAWTGPAGFTANTANIENLSAGIYSLDITDGRGCVVTVESEIIEPECEQPEPPTETCDCEMEADGVELFDVPIYKLKRTRKRGRRCGYKWVKVGVQKVRFLGTEYDEASNTTAFRYKISSCEAPNVSNVIFGTRGNRFQGCYRPGNVLSASGAQCVYWKRGDYTGISGVKFNHICWHQNECASENANAELTFTMPGNVGVSNEGFFAGVRAGRGVGRIAIPGPDCSTVECPNGQDRMAEEAVASQTDFQGNILVNTNNNTLATLTQDTRGMEEAAQPEIELTMETITEADEIDPLMEVFPNPFVEYVNIVLEQPTERKVTLEVTDAAGKLIHTREVDGGYSIQKIDLATQADGIYLVHIKGEGITPSTHKVVKN